MTSRNYKNIKKDLQQRLTADLNALVSYATEQLAQETVSPVLTGFFASSWKADTRRPQPKDIQENFAPWSTIKKVTLPNGGIKLAPGEKPVIMPRYVVPTFKLNQTIFIGNTVKYAAAALASPKNNITGFVQGEFKDLVSLFFSDKPQRIRIAAQRGSQERQPLSFFGVGRQEYVSYTAVED